MECPYCDNGKSIAKQTYHYAGTVYRQRVCDCCGKRMRTFEQEIFEDNLTEIQSFKDAQAFVKSVSRKKARTKIENK